MTISESTVNGTTSRVDALVDDKGVLRLEGHDTGAAPAAVFGDSDYEWWVRVSAADRDRVLLHLLAERFGDTSGEFTRWLDENAIPYEFDSYS